MQDGTIVLGRGYLHVWETEMKSERQLERIMKGVANHRRIAILAMLRKEPELSVDELSERFNVGMKTIAEHIRKLAIAGLVMKRHAGRRVRHRLTDRGNSVLQFLGSVQ